MPSHAASAIPAPSRRRRAWATAATLAILTVCLACLAAPVQAAKPWSEERRTVSGVTDSGGFTVRSSRSSDRGADDLALLYDARTASLGIEFTSTEPATTDLGQRLTVLAVLAFNDTDGDGRLSLDEPVLQRLPVPGTAATSTVKAEAGGGWRAVAVHTLPAGNGSRLANATGQAAGNGTAVQLEVEVHARPAASDGKPPTRVDVAWRVANWVRPATHLALEAALVSDARPDDVAADAARVRDQGVGLALAWQDGQGTVQTGSDARSATFVRSQALSGDGATFPAAVTASYAEADRRPGPEGDVAVYATAALAALALIAIPTWRRLRGGDHG